MVASCSSRCESSVDELSKYERILRFVEDTQVQPIAHAAPTGDFEEQQQEQLGEAGSSWYHSYDEEAEEGCSDSDEQQDSYLMHASSSSSAAAAATANSNSVYASPFYRSRLASMEAQFAQVAAARPHFHYSYDEEATEDAAWAVAVATTSFAADCAQAARDHKQQQAARTDRRARSIRRARRAALAATAAAAATAAPRSALRADYGPLERCEPWVDPAATAYAAAARAAGPSGRYGAVLANGLASVRRSAVEPLAGGFEEVLARLRAADKRLGEFRAPQAWHLTFDEDVHGSYDEASVMGSC